MANESTAPVKGGKQYKIDPNAIFQFPLMVTVVPQNLDKPDWTKVKTVSLSGKEQKKVHPETKEAPERVQIIEAATQEQLKFLFETGHPFIIEE